ncbi:MAG: hypothetical protein ABIJ96_03760 [Elusimicrobiota bacterium]
MALFRRQFMLAAAAILAVAVLLSAAAAAENTSNTAGTNLIKVWTQARRKYSDAMLISISGRTESAGTPFCDPQDPFRNGWRYTFYSPAKDAFIMMAECGGAVVGPLTQMRDRGASKLFVEGKFADSDAALKTLARSGASIDPADYQVRTRRPFLLTLYRIQDDRFKTHPTVWKIRIGEKSFLIDAVKNEMFSPKSYGVSLGIEVSTEAYRSEALGKRPKRTDVHTARSDLDKVRSYAKKRFKNARLMGIEGFSNAWGGSPCTGAGDGWAYYFYNPSSRGFEAVYACNGSVGPGPSQYIPIDLNLHEAIAEPFVDSSDILDGLIVNFPAVMNEGMGRNFTRNASLLLRQFRASPLRQPGQWEIRAIWRVTVGRTSYRFDAKTGKLLGTE